MRRFIFLAVLLSLATPSLLMAQTPANLFSEGKAQFDAGNYEAAYDTLNAAFLADPTNLEISFLLGRAAYEKGDYESALMAFERILIMQPDANRVKLELARTNLKLGSREMAKQYFREVLATNPPQKVMDNINNILTAIAAGEKNHFFNGILSTSYNWDDNANGTPSENILYLFGNIPVALSQEKKRDQYFGEQAILNHIYRIQDTPYSWKTTATLYGNFYESQKSQDASIIALSTGPVKQTEKYMWSNNISVASIETAYDRYMESVGIASALTTPLSPATILNLSAVIQDRTYYQDRNKDSVNVSVSTGATFTRQENRLTITATAERDNASATYNKYNRYIINTRYDRELPDNFSAFAGVRYQETKYDAALPIFGKRQKDEQFDATLGLSRLLWKSNNGRYNLAGQLGHTFTDVNSNITVYGYKKNVTSLTFILAF